MESRQTVTLSGITEETLRNLQTAAWTARQSAEVLGTTKVGSAVLSADGCIFVGCNIEHPFRCHDIHAEVNAIGSMVTAGGKQIKLILIVADRERFTPCGGCMDWIMLFSSEDSLVAFQSSPNGNMQTYRAKELMPFYPK